MLYAGNEGGNEDGEDGGEGKQTVWSDFCSNFCSDVCSDEEDENENENEGGEGKLTEDEGLGDKVSVESINNGWGMLLFGFWYESSIEGWMLMVSLFGWLEVLLISSKIREAVWIVRSIGDTKTLSILILLLTILFPNSLRMHVLKQ